MAFLIGNILLFILLLALLLISGLFSGSETVFFSLSRHDRARMKKSKNRLEVRAATLLDHPRALLSSLLIGNISCNIIIFIVSALLLSQLRHAIANLNIQGAQWFANLVVAILLVVPPILVTYVSDVLPKVVGALNNTRIAPLLAIPVSAWMRLLWPINQLIDRGIVGPIHRLVVGQRRRSFSSDELRELLEMSEKQGVIDVSENELLQEVVRIAELRIKDVMTPRVDIIAFDIKDSPEKLMALFNQSHLAKLPVYEGQIDNVIGLVYAKAVLLQMDGDPRRLDVRRLLQPVRFVPEQQPLDRLLVHFRQTRSQLAVVVDEFGGLVGLVALEDIVERMVGDIYEPYDVPEQTVQRVGPDEYLVPGDLSVADWMDAFEAKIESTHMATVAGLLASALKRLPREGDEVRLAHLLMKVDSMRGRRVNRVRLKLLTNGDSKSHKGHHLHA